MKDIVKQNNLKVRSYSFYKYLFERFQGLNLSNIDVLIKRMIVIL